MAGYVAMSRVHGARVRAMAWPDARGAADGMLATPTRVVEGTVAIPDEPQGPTVRERLAWWREELGMMTFFLLDPESWR